MKEYSFERVRNEGLLLYDYQRGSYVYNLQRPDGQSDIDTAGVFIEPDDWFFALEPYPEQIKDEKGDMVWYTTRKFFNLLVKSNPAIIEALLIPEDNILYVDPLFKELVLGNATKFFSKGIYETFTKYAMSQIKKARGLNKKIVNPVEYRKSILEFCYTFDALGYGKEDLWEFLQVRNIPIEKCGAARIPNMHNMYAIFYNPDKPDQYKGIVKEGSENIHLSSIPKGEKPVCQMHYNQEEFSKHCRDYHDYQEWLKNRNPLRYENYNDDKGTEYDKKNMMHCIRLLNLSHDLLVYGTANLKCRGHYRDFLMSIRNGEHTYEGLMEYATKLTALIEQEYQRSRLPERVDEEFVTKVFQTIITEKLITKR